MKAKFPPPLKSGDLVRVVSPAGPVNEAMLMRGVRRLERWGFKVELAPSALSKEGYLAGVDASRAEDLSEALLDPEVAAVLCSRGGYGTMRLLKDLPWDELAEASPKVFVGFSDIGALQLPLYSRCDWVTFSGPQVARGLGGDISERSANHLKGMLDGQVRKFAWEGDESIQLRGVRAGRAEGPIIGCCLSILVSLLGSEWFPNIAGSILAIEDVDEPPYRIDRMLWQLSASGHLDNINALILGHFIYRGEDISANAVGIALSLFSDHPFPIWSGLPYGHVNELLTLPIGAPSVVDEIGKLVVNCQVL